MTVQDHLRTLLESNKSVFLSGEEIARRLGVSRNAVWKAIKALQADGYPIQAVPNRGYCLAASSDVLSESGIRQYLTGEAQGLSLHVFDSVDSTNLVLRQLANQGAPEGTVVIQPVGIGGRRRAFLAALGAQRFSEGERSAVTARREIGLTMRKRA